MAGVKRKISEVDDAEPEPIPSVKDLASSESKLRRHAIQKVLSHLESRSPYSQITSTQALQLWRGFHVALYMHDSKSAISVQNLTIQLAHTFMTIHSKDEEAVAQADQKSNGNSSKSDKKSTDTSTSNAEKEEDEWNGLDDDDNNNDKNPDNTECTDSSQISKSWLSTWSIAFWSTIIREWSTIDSHRMNKYLLLVRLVTREIFAICLKAHLASVSNTPSTTNASQSTTLVSSQLSILSSYPLQPRDSKIPNGLKLHMLDIYTDELQAAYVIASTSTADQKEPRAEQDVNGDGTKEFLATTMLDPLRKMAKEGLVKSIRIRAREEIQASEEKAREEEGEEEEA